VAECGASAGCERFDDAICVGVGATAVQGDAATPGLCFERCSLGASADSKCHGRARVACAPVLDDTTSGSFCRPLCSNDADCAPKTCDPVHGVCIDGAPQNWSFGQRCDPNAGAAGAPRTEAGTDAPIEDEARIGDTGMDAAGVGDARGEATGADVNAGKGFDATVQGDGSTSGVGVMCDGLCVRLNGVTSVCSRRCVFGDTSECAPATGGLRLGGCLFATQGGSIGDVGYCGELCDCSEDCFEPAFVCDSFDDANLERTFGRKGVCTAPELVLRRALSCSK
jgi:hypothetical protein